VEDLKGMMQLVPVEEVYVKALQVKHLIINWEIYFEGKKDYWKIIRVGGHTTVYQFFVDMLKQFDRVDLHQLWALVKETLSIRQATKDKEKELWYLQNEHYALWEVIEFGDSYQAPPEETCKGSAYESYAKKKGRTAEGSETLEQTFNRLQAIVSHLEFIDVEIKEDDLNQNFFTSLAPKWLMYIIVWRNIDDLDIMSLDDVYNHLKVYEP
nr:ribonuclease H-like domain-containing protein [Tanacetum cinerariifolium]